jgi:hypothetical protein
MDKELNKYFPNDISNMIVKMVYKSMYDTVMKQLKRDFVLRYCNYPVMYEYRRLEFLNNWRRTRWMIKLYYYVQQKRLKYHQFYKKVINDSQYDFMKIVRHYISHGDELVMMMMRRYYFVSYYRKRTTKLRYKHLLKDSCYNSL